MEGVDSSFDGFSVEMQDFAVKKVKKFDRLVKIGEGGSIDQNPLVHEGRVYFGSMNHNVYCVDAKTGEVIWKFRTEDRIGAISSPVIADGLLFIGSYDHNMYALDAETGRLVWKFPTRGEILSVVRIRKGIVYFTSRDHNMYAVTADKGNLVWKFRTQDELQSTPEIYEDKVLFGSFDKNLYCVDAETGRLVWKFRTNGEVVTDDGLPIHDGIVYFTSYDTFLYAVEINTGRCIWKRSISLYGPVSSPVLYKGLLYQSTRDFFFLAIDLQGGELWRFRKNNILGIAAFHDDLIYLTSEDKNLYCLDLDGREIWKFRTDGPVWWKAAISGGVVYFSSYDCNLYAVDVNTRKLLWKFRCSGSPSYLPPANDEYEVEILIPKDEVDADVREKRYDIGFVDDDETAGAYKSKITYRMSTQYASKGKYQVDSDEEAL